MGCAMGYRKLVADRARAPGWVQAPQSWARVFAPRWFTLTIGALAVIMALLMVLLVKPGGTNMPVGAALIVALLASWIAETAGLRWPRFVFTGIVGAAVVGLLTTGHWSLAPMFLLLLVSWVGYVGTRWESWFALALALIGLLPLPLVKHDALADWLPWGAGIVYSWVAARALAAQQELLRSLRIAQADLQHQSAAEERRRIAREIHDVIAHSLAITMLHLTGARHVLGRDPEAAAAALAQAERLGRQSLADIRRTVGLLGAERANGLASALPGAPDIPRLITDFACAGLDVHSNIRGDLGRLSAAAGLDLYRIVQEALANVAKHAPDARVELDLAVRDDQATLCVRDSGSHAGAHPLASAAGSGLGLAGMRERATLLGGRFEACPEGDGWRIACAIPLEEAGLAPA